ncbi:MAG: metallophosphoesterase [Planctomycetes bacterium]|nr:metallophosphoesterase [Planctomycetota bacterium]
MQKETTLTLFLALVCFAFQGLCCAAESSPGKISAGGWHEGFEEYEPGKPLSPQSDWHYCRPEREDEAAAHVVRVGALEGKQALAVFRDEPTNRVFFVHRDFELPQEEVVWVDAHVKPSATPAVRTALDIRDGPKAVTHVGFAADGRNVVFSSFNRSYWRVFRDLPCTESRWYRLTERIDFATRTWSLWVDGKLHSCDLPLLDGAQQVTGIRVTVCGTEDDPAFVDKLYIGATPPSDIRAPESLPAPEPGHLFRFAVFGDPQIGFGDKQPPHAVDVVRLKAAIRQAEAAGCDLTLVCGDLVHMNTDAATAGLLEAFAACKKMTWYPVSGNHGPDPWYQEHIRKDLDYVVEHKGVTFIGMKTWAEHHQGGVTPAQLEWLKSKITDARQKKHEIVIWCHVTPYGPNPRGWWIRDGQEEMLGLCKEYEVLAVIAGHFHRELWHFQQEGTHHVITPGITLSRGQRGWVVYDVYPDRFVQHFKPLWSPYTAEGASEEHVVKGPLTFIRHAPAAATVKQ